MPDDRLRSQCNTIPIFFAAVFFMLANFVFTDLGIRLIYGYALMILLLFVAILSEFSRRSPAVSRFGAAYFVLALAITAFILLPNARMEYHIFAMMISLDTSACFVLFANPGQKEIKKALNFIVLFAAIISIYVLIVTARPAIYYDFISKIIVPESARVGKSLLAYGYGVSLGGNVVLIDYIVFLAIIVLTSKYIIHGKGISDFIKTFVPVALFLLVIVLENRKSELLVGIIVVVFGFLSKINFTTFIRRRRNFRILLFGLIAVVIAFIIMINLGYADRYLYFLKHFSLGGITGAAGSVDITSGRIGLWKKAVEIFLEKPVIGAGWGRFADYVDVYNPFINDTLENVHNNYLQLLCEVGIVGFLLVAVPMFYLFIRTVKCGKRLKRHGENALLARVINSVSWQFQLFNILISFIDPSWYKISFWWFFAVAVIMGQTSERMERRLCITENAGFRPDAVMKEIRALNGHSQINDTI